MVTFVCERVSTRVCLYQDCQVGLRRLVVDVQGLVVVVGSGLCL